MQRYDFFSTWRKFFSLEKKFFFIGVAGCGAGDFQHLQGLLRQASAMRGRGGSNVRRPAIVCRGLGAAPPRLLGGTVLTSLMLHPPSGGRAKVERSYGGASPSRFSLPEPPFFNIWHLNLRRRAPPLTYPFRLVRLLRLGRHESPLGTEIWEVL